VTASAVIAGLGTWLPARAMDNAELAEVVDTSDEWIRSRTGIARRHLVDPGTGTVDLAVGAGDLALRAAGMARTDAVVLATATPDRLCPASAPEVAARLGMTGVGAFDVAAVCTGFVYALATGAGLIAADIAASVLVIGADAFSTILDPRDRTTRSVFGDGAGAVVLRAGTQGEPGAVHSFDLGSDGHQAELIMIPGGGSRTRSEGPVEPDQLYFTMQGRTVFMQAVLRMSESSRRSLDRAAWKIDEVDHLVAHQANQRILRSVADELGLADSQVVSTIEFVGNTVAASIPLALGDAVAGQRLRPGHRVLLTAFGGGLTWGSAVVQWPDITVLRSTDRLAATGAGNQAARTNPEGQRP
jgi:3-oxoacyl-[acyl-carrier-protein] synthase III